MKPISRPRRHKKSDEYLSATGQADKIIDRDKFKMEVESQLPPMPDWLTEKGKLLWQQYILPVANYSILCDLDTIVCGSLIQTIEYYIKANQDLEKNPTDRAAIKLEDRYFIRMISLARELGMTPSSRIALGKIQNKKSDQSDIAKLLGLAG